MWQWQTTPTRRLLCRADVRRGKMKCWITLYRPSQINLDWFAITTFRLCRWQVRQNAQKYAILREKNSIGVGCTRCSWACYIHIWKVGPDATLDLEPASIHTQWQGLRSTPLCTAAFWRCISRPRTLLLKLVPMHMHDHALTSSQFVDGMTRQLGDGRTSGRIVSAGACRNDLTSLLAALQDAPDTHTHTQCALPRDMDVVSDVRYAYIPSSIPGATLSNVARRKTPCRLQVSHRWLALTARIDGIGL